MTRSKLLAFVLASMALSGCGGSSSSPSSPTPTPPAPPAPLTMTFTPTLPGPFTGNVLAIMPSERGPVQGMVTVAVNAYNLGKFHMVRGEIRWNAELFEFDAWGKGAMLDHDGTDWQFSSTPGELSLWLSYPSSQPARSGSGELISFRFKPKAGVRSGSSEIVWNKPVLYTADYGGVGLATALGGRLTVQ